MLSVDFYIVFLIVPTPESNTEHCGVNMSRAISSSFHILAALSLHSQVELKAVPLVFQLISVSEDRSKLVKCIYGKCHDEFSKRIARMGALLTNYKLSKVIVVLTRFDYLSARKQNNIKALKSYMIFVLNCSQGAYNRIRSIVYKVPSSTGAQPQPGADLQQQTFTPIVYFIGIANRRTMFRSGQVR